ncbi:MAG: AraC family transcriptional regulator [Bacteroidales bacterium]|jgi:AraC-like DNA-binding protein|nr:AraC family transcriptional regulator [Bacteroidales bacterium]
MLKKIVFIFALIFSVGVVGAHGQGLLSNVSTDDDLVSKYKHLSAQQLLDTAKFYERASRIETALVCYSLLINGIPQRLDTEHGKKMVEAYTNLSGIYFDKDNYRTAYELLIKALQLSEGIHDTTYLSRIYANIGNIYYRFDAYDLVNLYASEALKFSQDSVVMSLILNNLGYTNVKTGHLNEAFDYINQSLQTLLRHDTSYLNIIYHTLALYYQEVESYDSAHYYFLLSLNDPNNNVKQKAETMSDMGKLYLKTDNPDGAVFYINLSNALAKEHAFLGVLMDNYLTLSQIEKARGRDALAFEYFMQYSNFRDSIFSNGKIMEVNQLQQMYETSKTNQQIEQLIIDQQIKAKTIRYKNAIQYIMLVVLVLISTVLFFVFAQNKKLNTAYKVLFEKNIKIIELEDSSPEPSKYKKSTLSDEAQDELLSRIYALMEDVSVICDPELSVEKLADLLHSNRAYVSQVVNGLIKKKFRAFVNDYRIREAQRLFSEQNASKYTIEAVAFKTGFKSSTTFNTAFKEVTGVSPGFYMKSVKRNS